MTTDGGDRVLLEVDPCVVVASLASDLAAGRPVGPTLAALAGELGLRTAVLRAGGGDLLGVAGPVVHAVPARRDPRHEQLEPTLELPICGADGRRVAALTVVGARAWQLPVLRAVAAVLGLALARPCVLTAGDTGPPDAVSGSDAVELAEHALDAAVDVLHDGPVQALVVARYAADAAVRGGDPNVVRDAVQAALVELRRTLWHLRPRGADGLGRALEALSGRRAEAGAPALRLAIDPAARLEAACAVTAYRMVQAVTGAREGSPPVAVTVRRERGRVVVEALGGAPLPDPGVWVRRAQAVGGALTTCDEGLRLDLPLAARPASPIPRPKAST